MPRMSRTLLLTLITLTIIFVSPFRVADAQEAAEKSVFYVSPSGDDTSSGNTPDKPYATLQRARDAIRALKQRGDLATPVTVYLRGGEYELSETLVFTPEDSGTEACPITYRAYEDEEPVLSGGKRIDGQWKKHDENIWVCSLAEVKEGGWAFRQLFLNGERQLRARIPNEDYLKIQGPSGESAFEFRENDLRNWQNLNDVEIVLFHSSDVSRLLVSELNEETRTVTFSGPIGRNLSKGRRANRYFVENVLEGLDQPGEWYLNRRTGDIYYWPTEGAQLSDLRAPVLDQLLRFEGDIEKKEYVQHVEFAGLTFSDTAYHLPKEGFPGARAFGGLLSPVAITLEGAVNCSFTDNKIRNVGTYALEVAGHGNSIVGNEIYDTGGGGIIIRSYGSEQNLVSSNRIHQCGRVFPGAVGINIDDGGGIIANNLIHDISYSGIYARHAVTDYNERERKNQEQPLVIENNEIYGAMKDMNDGGAIFVGGSNVTIRKNIAHDVASYGRGAPGFGIYLGHNTRNAQVENNLVYKTDGGVHVWHGNKNVTIENNMFMKCTDALLKMNNPKDAMHENVRVQRNVFYYEATDADLASIGGERSLPAVSNYNALWNPRGCIWLNPVIWGLRDSAYMEEWQSLGFDKNSIVKDLLLVDVRNDDYTLKPGSPAFDIGFKPIDFSTVGPQR